MQGSPFISSPPPISRPGVFGPVTTKQSPLQSLSHTALAISSPRWRLRRLWGAVEQLGWLSHSSITFSHQITKLDSTGGWSACNLRLLAAWSQIHASKGGCVGSCPRHYLLQRWVDRTQALSSPGFRHLPWGCKDALGIFISTPSLLCSSRA